MSIVLEFNRNKPFTRTSRLAFDGISDALKYTPSVDPQQDDHYFLPGDSPDPVDSSCALHEGAALSINTDARAKLRAAV